MLVWHIRHVLLRQTNVDFNISQLHMCTPQKMKAVLALTAQTLQSSVISWLKDPICYWGTTWHTTIQVEIHFLGKTSTLLHRSQLIICILSCQQCISYLNDFMCGPLNHKGLLCRDCLDGFGPAVFTTGYACENCTVHSHYGIVLYLLLEMVPITAFYFFVLAFQIRVTFAPLIGFILFSQAVVVTYSNNVSVRIMLGHTGSTCNILAKILLTG